MFISDFPLNRSQTTSCFTMDVWRDIIKVSISKEGFHMVQQIGENISRFRQNQNMTQEEFASRLGVTPQAVSKWERGDSLR